MNLKSPSNYEKLKIFIDIKTLDLISFSQIYSVILDQKTSYIYLHIYSQKKIFDHLNIIYYELSSLLKNLNLTYSEFKAHIHKLEKLKLAKLSIKNNVDGVEYYVSLFSPLCVSEALKNESIKSKLKEHLSEEKFSELCLLTENNDVGYDLELNNLNSNDNFFEDKKTIIDKQVYCEFYGGILKTLSEDFTVSDNVLDNVYKYYVKEKIISMELIQKFALDAMKKKDKKYYICENAFNFLLKNSINKKDVLISSEQYDEYWRNLLKMTKDEAIKKFKLLFSEYETNNFYIQLTKKNKVPSVFSKFIKNCIANKNLSYELINAVISFTNTLLKKISVKYCERVCETLHEEELYSIEQVIDHFQEVIESDLKNKNRMDIKHASNDWTSKFWNN